MRIALAFGFLVLLAACSGPVADNSDVQVTEQEMQDAGLDELEEIDAALADLENLDAELDLDAELAALDEDLQLE